MTEELPLVSILMPNYNNALYLKECLDSVFNQSFSDYVIVIVDDASTDNSVEIIKNYCDHRIILLQKDSNSGIVDALNLGLKSIKSKYILRMDGDDVMHPDRINKLVDFMENNPTFDVCSSGIQTFGFRNSEIIFETDPEMNKANLIFGHSIGHASSIFRSSIFFDNNIEYTNDYQFMEDYDLFYRIKDKSRTTSISSLLYFYRINERHHNAAFIEQKKNTFLSFYTRLLRDLGLEPSDTDVLSHFELSKNVKPSFSLSHYKQHLRKVILFNRTSKVFPNNELKRVLQNSYIRMVYRMIENKKVSILNVLYHSLIFGRNFFYFWLRKKMNKVISNPNKK